MSISERFTNRKCIIRTNSAGVFFGTLQAIDGDSAIVSDARRLWYWSGAASLSQLAIDGTSKPDDCKFPAAVQEALLFGVIEVLPVTEEAEASIEAVKEWKA